MNPVRNATNMLMMIINKISANSPPPRNGGWIVVFLTG